MAPTKSDLQLDRVYKSLVIVGLVIAALVITKDMMVPLVFSALFAVVLHPIEARIEKRTGRIFSIIIVLVGSFIFVGMVVWFIIHQLTSLVASLPTTKAQFTELVTCVSGYVSDVSSLSVEEQTRMAKEIINNMSSYLGELLLSTSYLIYFFIQVPIYVFIFLLYREKFHKFFQAMLPESKLAWKSDIQGVVRNYISGLLIVVLIAGTLNSIGLLVLGIPHAIFFGFLSGMLTMIPYIGITLGATLPALLAIVTKDSLWYAVGVVGVHAFVQFLEGNFITPRITGSKISINALAAILALLVGGEIWGIAGMILAIPAVGILKILLAYSSSLKPLVILIEDKAQTADEIRKVEQIVKEEGKN